MKDGNGKCSRDEWEEVMVGSGGGRWWNLYPETANE